MQSDKGFVKTVVERDESTGIGLVQDPEDGIRTVIAAAYIYTTLLEESTFV